MTLNFDQLFQQLETGVETAVKTVGEDYLNEAKSDGENLVNDLKADLMNWTQEVENGAMTMDDLEFLLKEEASFTEMTALKQAGLAAVHIDEFRDALINSVLSTLLSFVKV